MCGLFWSHLSIVFKIVAPTKPIASTGLGSYSYSCRRFLSLIAITGIVCLLEATRRLQEIIHLEAFQNQEVVSYRLMCFQISKCSDVASNGSCF